MASSADRKVIAYIADISDIKAKLQELQMLNQRLGRGLGNDVSKGFTKVGQSIGQIKTTEARKGLDDLANTSTRTSTIMKGLDGSLVQVTKTTSVNSKGIARVSTSYKDLEKNSVSLGENISRLAKRAMLTIPLWLVLRGVMMGVTSTFKNGIKAIIDQDKAFQKAKRNISGSTASIETDYKKLQKSAMALSIETGKSIEEIVNSFQKFATVGFDFDTAWKGTVGAIKTSILMFGDATETANAFARSMRVLVDRSDSAKSAGQQIAEAMAQTAELWKTNAFELNEFTNDLEKFAGTAKTTNITTKETIALLATLSTAGLRNRGGRLLRTSIQKLLVNLDKLGETLGIQVNPELDTTFSILTKVIGELERLQTTSGALGPATKIISEIFGGVRGAEVVRALVALRTELDKNIEVTGDLKKFNEEFDVQNATVNQLAKRFTNLNKEIGKAFVVGISGGDAFKETLKGIVEAQGDVIVNAKLLGEFFLTIGKGIKELWGEVLREINIATLGTSGRVGEMLNLVKEVDRAKASLDNFESGATQFGVALARALEGQLKGGELDRVIAGIETRLRNVNIEPEWDRTTLEKSLEVLTKLSDIEKEITSENEKQLEANKKSEVLQINKQEISKLVLNNKLAELKAQGALESQILKTTGLIIKRLGIEEQTIDKVSRQLELERALSDEKRLQSEIGNESLKLFNIAKENGPEVAKQIGDVLSGAINFDNFIRRGGEAVDIFKKEFADVFEQQQAKAFFQGRSVVGEKGLRGGRSIAIQEEAIRGVSSTVPAMLSQKKAERQFTQLETIAPVTAKTEMNVNIDVSKLDEVSKKVTDDISAQLPKVGTKINIALKNALLGKQSV
jgi:hypothetical protein